MASRRTFQRFCELNEVQNFRNFGGIRNEEDYMMTENGARRLGTKLKPKTVEEVEAIRRAAL
jgi:Xaa-Pro aminopeptidase